MKSFSKAEQYVINSMPITELDKQIMLGNWYPVCINDGRIVGAENEDYEVK